MVTREQYQLSTVGNIFTDFLQAVAPIKVREPLAETLGAFKQEGAILEYTYIDVIKLAGHACPTTAAAYLSCQKALETLYPNETPVRGEITITVYGEADEGVYGVMAQVFSLLTGAAPSSGFRGLGHKFKRKDLIKFTPQKIDPQAMCFEFSRLDNGKTVLVKFYPQEIPFSAGKSQRMGELLETIIWEAAKAEERKEFQQLWMGKVENMLLKRREIDRWLKLEIKEESK